ncbi:MarR family winged helix-turn-helix transcriptional regulator [Nocardia sp. NPDC051570]|uniref:MarR family winged helix-turn-helix transcriptional regulator n=1 Tax=Nocardia sp. NPDC051570 TaxID=3364324 RepID=UPI0037B714ED
MPRSSPPVAPDLMATLAQFCRTYQQDFLAAAQSLDLTGSHASLLCLLAEPRAMRELAESLSCDASNITLIIDRLEQRGLVERHIDPADRRVKKVVATAEGAAIAAQVHARMRGIHAALDSLTPARRRSLRDILHQLGSHPAPGTDPA